MIKKKVVQSYEINRKHEKKEVGLNLIRLPNKYYKVKIIYLCSELFCPAISNYGAHLESVEFDLLSPDNQTCP